MRTFRPFEDLGWNPGPLQEHEQEEADEEEEVVLVPLYDDRCRQDEPRLTSELQHVTSVAAGT